MKEGSFLSSYFANSWHNTSRIETFFENFKRIFFKHFITVLAILLEKFFKNLIMWHSLLDKNSLKILECKQETQSSKESINISGREYLSLMSMERIDDRKKNFALQSVFFKEEQRQLQSGHVFIKASAAAN